MHEDLLGQLQTGGLQHDWPVDRVEFQDILADHVDVRRPKVSLFTTATRNAQIISQRIKPYVGDVVRIKG